jgi:hypothetical protein
MENNTLPEIAVFFFLAIGAISLFTFLSVATWAGTRAQERESYYKAEMMKRIAELGGEGKPALEYLREQERSAVRKKIAGMKVGGLINVAVGVALLIFLRALLHGAAVYLCATIPLFVGLALLTYAIWFAPQEQV